MPLADKRPLPDMTGNGLVIGQGRQRKSRPIGRIVQVDVVDRRPRAVQGARAHIAQPLAQLDVDRHPLDHHFGLQDHLRQLGHQRAHRGDAAVQIGEDLGPAFVRVRKQVARVLAEVGHPLANRPLAQALGPEQAIHPRLDGLVLLQAHLVDLVGRQRCRGPDLERPGVIGLSVRQAPDARVMSRLGGVGAERRDLPVEGWKHLVLDDPGGVAGIVAGNALGRRPAGQRGHQPRLGRRRGAIVLHLGQGGGQDVVRRYDAQARIASRPLGLLVEHDGQILQPRQIGVSVGGGVDLVL